MQPNLLTIAAMFPLFAITASVQATDRIYALVPDTPFYGSPFGFSGTITTDGSTGYFSDVSFIKDWAVTVETPSDLNGINTEVLTRDTYPPIRASQLGGHRHCACFHVTESSISIVAPSLPLESLTLSIGVTDVFVFPTILSWRGPYFASEALLGSVTIGDRGESPSSESRPFGDLTALPVAAGGVSVPEPETLFVLLTTLAAIFACRHCPHRSHRAMLIAASTFLFVAFSSVTQADIFQWEYINPADPSQGKQQSTTLAPDGAGVDAVPGVDLSLRNLQMAYLNGVDLSNAHGHSIVFADADLTNANLRNVSFENANFVRADFTGADVRGAFLGLTNYSDVRGISLPQLYSTASYQSRDLSGIVLTYKFLNGGSFAGQKLTNAGFSFSELDSADFREADLTGAAFYRASLTDVDFSGAKIRGATFEKLLELSCGWTPEFCVPVEFGTGITSAQLYSTASYTERDLSDINLGWNDLAGASFAGQNLTNASLIGANLTDADFASATLTGADFTNAEINGANLAAGACISGLGCFRPGTGITPVQLYSTASYQGHNLSGISLNLNNLTGGSFAGQNLTDASFVGATLTDANFRGANLTNARFATVVCDLLS